MTVRERVLSVAVAALRPLLPATVLVSGRVARAAAERRGVVDRLRGWAEAHRDPERALLWLHGASAGELAGAASIVGELRARRPLQLAVSYFSPSAEPILPRLEPDVAEPLPLDTLGECRGALRALRPDAVVFARGDVWPNFTRAAAREGIPLALVNGTVPPESRRLVPLARWLTAPAYGRLERVGAVSGTDAERLARLGADPSAIRVTGDAALETAAARLEDAGSRPGPAKRLGELLPEERPVLLGGSTWREDEAVLLETARRAAAGGGPISLVLVPHEPDAEAIRAIGRRCSEVLGVAPRLWSEADGTDGAPLVVDAIGLLAELYPAADVAWVGGGMGEDGLHSVVEPAAAGVPVLFGDRSSRPEAEELRRRDGGAALTAAEAPGVLVDLLCDPERRSAMGRAARRYVEEGSGAARAAAELVEELLDSRVPSG